MLWKLAWPSRIPAPKWNDNEEKTKQECERQAETLASSSATKFQMHQEGADPNSSGQEGLSGGACGLVRRQGRRNLVPGGRTS